MQTSKEVVKAAIEFTIPDRLPVMFGQMGHNDVHWIGRNHVGREKSSHTVTLPNSYVDEWDCVWQKTELENMGQIKIHPIDEWEKLDAYIWPDPDNKAYYEGIENQFKGSEDKYIVTGIFMLLFEKLQALRGFENVLTDLHFEQEKISYLADLIVDYNLRIIKNMSSRFPGKIHGLNFTDDWGTETALMINPKMWDEFFKPRYKIIFDACHEADWHVWMHSCGKVNEMLAGLVDIGCDVINLQQPRALGIRQVGKDFAGKICFQTTCDIQHTMPFEDADYIREEAKLLMECWGTDKGGFILSDYGSDAAIGTTREKTEAMFEAFMKYDRWKKV